MRILNRVEQEYATRFFDGLNVEFEIMPPKVQF